MTVLNISLKDKNGNPVQIGDKIKAVLPEMTIFTREHYGEGAYLNDISFQVDKREIEGILWFRVSQGLVVKVTSVKPYEGDEKNGKPYTRVGQYLKFKSVAWEWERVGNRDKPFEYSLADSNGVGAQFGDIIKVKFPKMSVGYKGIFNDDFDSDNPFDSKFYFKEVIAQNLLLEGELRYQLSRGAFIKLTSVLQDCKENPGYLKLGQSLPFYQKMEWEKSHAWEDGPWAIELEEPEVIILDSPYKIGLSETEAEAITG